MIFTDKHGKRYQPTATLAEIAAEYQPEYKSPIVAGFIDYAERDLQTAVGEYKRLDFITLESREGQRVYRRSVQFLLITAVNDLYPLAEVEVGYAAREGFLFHIRENGKMLAADAAKIEKRMQEIVAEERPIIKKTLQREAAAKLFQDAQQLEKANLIADLPLKKVSIYFCGDFYDYLYGALVGNTSYLKTFSVENWRDGFLVRVPEWDDYDTVAKLPTRKKMDDVLHESRKWAKILNCNYVPDLNRFQRNGDMREIIQISEALHEKKIAQIADHITENKDDLRLILIAGPSSSGKTSFAQRLRVQLRVNGLEPISISMDDYYKARKDTPLTPEGEYDFECIEAVDIELFNRQMLKILAGEEVIVPRFNFVTGQREWTDTPLSINKDQPIIIEGIHGLNERLTSSIARSNKYKIYISPFTQLGIDAHNSIPIRDARLIRRLVRDSQFRGAHALKTLKQWPVVKQGEEKYIFPFEEEADVMFNSSLIYELGVLKKYAEPLLAQVGNDVPEYGDAKRLRGFLMYFDNIYDEDDIPNNSILREFVGGSIFFK